MERVAFFVGQRPIAVWDPDIRGKNGQFLQGLDTEHFAHVAQAQIPYLDTPRRQQAATAIRIGYGLALEALLALIAAVLQAPRCVFGWLDLYAVNDLRFVLDAIRRRLPCREGWRGPHSWNDVAASLLAHLSLDDKALEEDVKRRFASFWAVLAAEFLNGEERDEYNSLKHGFRVRPGGFGLSVGLNRLDGSPPETMQDLGTSEFGSRTFPLCKLGNLKCDRGVTTIARNWDPRSLAVRLRLISLSMANVVSAARAANGEDPRQLRFETPDELTDFDNIHGQVGVSRFSTGSPLTAERFRRPTTLADVQAAHDGWLDVPPPPKAKGSKA